MRRSFLIYSLLLFALYLIFLIVLFRVSSTRLNWTFFLFLATGLASEVIGFRVQTNTKPQVRLTGGMLVNVFAAVVLRNILAVIIASFSVIFSGLFLVKSKRFTSYLFNVSQIGLSTSLVVWMYNVFKTENIVANMWLVLLLGFFYMLLNAVQSTFAIYFNANTSILGSLKLAIRSPLLSATLMLPLAAVSYLLYELAGISAIPLVFAILAAVQIGNMFRNEYEQSKLDKLKLMVKSLEMRDSYTSGHSERASQLAYDIGKTLGLSERLCERIKMACMLHDVGKIGIPDYILGKPEKLSDVEFDIIKTHSVKSEELLKSVKGLKEEAKWVRHHHERWDGLGYPDNLAGEEIPLPSRIIAIADIYEALTSDRPYRKAYTKQEAIEMIKQMSGTVLDPKVVDAFLKVIDADHSGSGREKVQG
ncbi:HD-GYP domain-containing protein [Pseudothermotoga sp.]|nr:HD-GYP domain-containing protein [Pseudothermotoga sp.]MCX7812763.1 HD-GYP domain-containing protein [Pseudothermotoga sp.]MDW8139043.1 HD-GYP domain-containing protein [Pseudothermotoga sp.]